VWLYCGKQEDLSVVVLLWDARMIDVQYHLCSSNWTEYEPDEYVSCFVAEVMTEDHGNFERRVQVGEMNGCLVHVDYAREKHERLFQVFEDHSDALAGYFRALFSRWTNDYKKGLLEFPATHDDILIVDDLIIYPRYRGKNLGLKALMNAMKTFGMSCGVVLCQAFPLQYHQTIDVGDFRRRIGSSLLFVEKGLSLSKIVQHLGKIGFKRIPGTTLCMIETAAWRLESFIEFCA
jgi:GNAT superfamily N-acetyltransferase